MSTSPLEQWPVPPAARRITTIDAHTGGEPLRIITSGLAAIPGRTMIERRAFAEANLDALRRTLMLEPRGHREMYGCIVTPPVSEGADFGVLFLHNDGFSTMCGHGIIAVATVAAEAGVVPVTDGRASMRIDTPAGPVSATARMSGGRATGVAFRNVPSYVVALDQKIDVPGVGAVRYDLAFGGAYYAFVEAASIGLSCRADEHQRLIDAGMAIKRAVMAARPISHPIDRALAFLYGTILIAPGRAPGVHSRNVCVFADGQVDRSPTGTGVSARLAIHHRLGEIEIGESIVIESIVGSTFTGRVVETTSLGPYPAIVPEVEGEAYVTGRHEFIVDPADAIGAGFFLG